MKTIINSLLTVMLVMWLASCSKMDATFRDYVVPGGITYVGKADSVKVYPGRERLKITWRRGTDPNTTSAVVYWNNKKDSLIVLVKESNPNNVVTANINTLPEGTYTFQIYNRDASGNQSIRVDVQGASYGSVYEGAILSRTLGSIKTTGNSVNLKWLSGDPTSIATEISYTNQAGALQKVSLAENLDSIVLPNVKSGSSFTYRSLYKPNENSLDTFYTATETRPFNIAADKPVKTSSTNSTNTGALAVDELTTTNWAPTEADRKDADKTVWISVDLKAATELNTVRFIRGGAGVPKTYRIMVSDNETTWTQVFTKTNAITTTEDVTFTAVTRRYVRIEYVFDVDGAFNVPEVEVYKR